jgi:translation initiation factor 2 beta subunit (eIF-2beta)/eIF-5
VGAVIGGTLQQGVLAVGDWIEVRPGILRRGPAGELVAQPVLSRVRGLRCDTVDLPYAIPGSLIAIATDLDPGLSIANGMVGQRVGVPGTLPPIAGELTLRLYRLKRDNHSFGKHKVGDSVRVCSNVMTVEGKVTYVVDSKHLTVTLSRPLCVGIGERVGLLRHHPDAGRELIEGAASVRDLVPWANTAEPDGIALATAPTRTVVWEPMNHDAFAPAPLDYGTMLADVMGMRSALNNGSSFRLPEIVVSRIPKHTIWGNWGEVTALLDLGNFGTLPYRDHLLDYVQADLSTTGNLNGMGQLVLAGKWRAEDLRALLRKYVGTFKRCAQCQQTDTGLVRDRVVKVRCSRCMSDSVTG